MPRAVTEYQIASIALCRTRRRYYKRRCINNVMRRIYEGIRHSRETIKHSSVKGPSVSYKKVTHDTTLGLDKSNIFQAFNSMRIYFRP